MQDTGGTAHEVRGRLLAAAVPAALWMAAACKPWAERSSLPGAPAAAAWCGLLLLPVLLQRPVQIKLLGSGLVL